MIQFSTHFDYYGENLLYFLKIFLKFETLQKSLLSPLAPSPPKKKIRKASYGPEHYHNLQSVTA